ncbi:D-alanyl-D-alanine carboxypeptidase family protein [Alkaliphilus hydrothermalis]|uniref:serine-type D-Ala-D-Ala carboxypeptidase n=1 Tax=Alkaliphilus hydrothermalis TaxID=1482730 RepID=A0ABS2NM83_9FIRM|nr:D-alanyl-D-alanine carboxypeptidase family protein [Alkaliphilus hydrothermalis]MBM7614029.1 D-alanyl-D-alanine carboxypeptidase (penicillin-binding protein 5/6) [Alkaliphilus hydrothermalis]
MKLTKKLMRAFLIITLIISFSMPQVDASSQPFNINAKSAILIDSATGTVLYEKNIHEALPPASVTKIMTMLLTMEAIEEGKITLEDKVVVSELASSMGGTQLYLEPGEVKTIEELMKGIAIRSANDACVAIGEHLAGSEDLFVQRMNERAKELGMKDSNFVNTNGLPEDGHVTSAYDISLMSKELLKHKEIHKWLTTWMDEVVVGKSQSVQQLVNTNRLIRFYDGANGIKTGYTSAAKHCLSASATRGNTTFIAVIMGAPTSPIRFSEAAKLLDYGFANYSSVDVVKKDTAAGSVPVEKGKLLQVEAMPKEDLKLLVKKGEEGTIDHDVILPQYVQAPIAKGEKIGEVIVTVNGKEKARVDLVAAEDVGKASIMDILSRMVRKFVGR